MLWGGIVVKTVLTAISAGGPSHPLQLEPQMHNEREFVPRLHSFW